MVNTRMAHTCVDHPHLVEQRYGCAGTTTILTLFIKSRTRAIGSSQNEYENHPGLPLWPHVRFALKADSYQLSRVGSSH